MFIKKGENKMSYILMNKDVEILEFLYDNETHTVTKIVRMIHPNYAPLGIIEYRTGITRKALNNWWEDCSIPASRSRFKEVMGEMDLHSPVNCQIEMFWLSLSDQYWIKEGNSDIQWADINFFENDFSEDMGKLLMGQIHYSDEFQIFLARITLVMET